jgi:hypothetical protein
MSLKEVKESYSHVFTGRGRKKQLRSFGQENRDYIKRDFLKENCLADPLKGLQSIIVELYFNPKHKENHNIRPIAMDNFMEVYQNGTWTKMPKTRIYNKMIYMSCDILEYNIPRKYWSDKFEKFLFDMNDLNNDRLLEFIREELDETFADKTSGKNLVTTQ